MRTASRPAQGVLLTIVRRFQAEHMMQTSAALAFTTLLALVPMLTLMLSLAAAVPFLDGLVHRLDTLVVDNLLPAGSGGTIAGYVSKFVQKARRLTVPGIAVLGVTAFILMHTIERTFNHLWHVKPRPFLARLRLYVFVMAIWPVILGAVAGVISFAVTVSLGFVDEPTWVRRFLLKAVSMALLGLFFAFLYYAVPNAKVNRWSAAAGGTFASLAVALMQKGFELYLSSFKTLDTVYGAFAAVPIFLVWLQLSWAVVMVGGLVAATLGRPTRR